MQVNGNQKCLVTNNLQNNSLYRLFIQNNLYSALLYVDCKYWRLWKEPAVITEVLFAINTLLEGFHYKQGKMKLSGL